MGWGWGGGRGGAGKRGRGMEEGLIKKPKALNKLPESEPLFNQMSQTCHKVNGGRQQVKQEGIEMGARLGWGGGGVGVETELGGGGWGGGTWRRRGQGCN